MHVSHVRTNAGHRFDSPNRRRTLTHTRTSASHHITSTRYTSIPFTCMCVCVCVRRVFSPVHSMYLRVQSNASNLHDKSRLYPSSMYRFLLLLTISLIGLVIFMLEIMFAILFRSINEMVLLSATVIWLSHRHNANLMWSTDFARQMVFAKPNFYLVEMCGDHDLCALKNRLQNAPHCRQTSNRILIERECERERETMNVL